MKKVKVDAYQTTDGKIWHDKEEAEAHQDKINITAKMIEGDLLVLRLAKVRIPKKAVEGNFTDRLAYEDIIEKAWLQLQSKLDKCVTCCPGDLNEGGDMIETVQRMVKLFGMDGIKQMVDFKL
jgi:hypothetical protein